MTAMTNDIVPLTPSTTRHDALLETLPARVRQAYPEPLDRLHQYLGVWCMDETRFHQMRTWLSQIDLNQHIEDQRQAAGTGREFAMLAGGIAQINVVGVMTKYGSSLSMMRDGAVGVRKQVRAAARDDKVKAIVLRIDSPGGSVGGVADLADEVRAAAAVKPVTAFIEDIGASAAYRVAVAANRVVAGRGAVVGSIGTYMIVDDFQGFYAARGVKTYVVASGRFKGAGIEGTEITGEQLANWQREIDEINEGFLADVMAGRRMTRAQVDAIADGAVHVGQRAVDLGLVDEIGTLDGAVAALKAQTGGGRGGRRSEETAMDKDQTTDTAAATPKPATVAELKAALPDSTADFREQCIEQGHTLAQATTAWLDKLREENQALKAQREAAERKQRKPGVAPAGTAGAGDGDDGSDPQAAIEQKVQEKMAQGMTRPQAWAAVCRENPALREAYVAAHNAEHGRRRVD